MFPGDLLVALLRPVNWDVLGPDAERLFAICGRALGMLDSLEDEQLPDGRFVGPHLQLTLRSAIDAYLNR